MSEEDQRAIAEAEAKDDFSSEAYAKANEHFMLLHCAGEVTEDSPSVFAGRSVLVLRLISMVGDQMNTLLLVRSVIMITPTVRAKSKCLAW